MVDSLGSDLKRPGKLWFSNAHPREMVGGVDGGRWTVDGGRTSCWAISTSLRKLKVLTLESRRGTGGRRISPEGRRPEEDGHTGAADILRGAR